MLICHEQAPLASLSAACDICGDRIHDVTKGVAWMRPVPKGARSGCSMVYFAHPGRCFDRAVEFLQGDIASGSMLPALSRMAPRLVRGMKIPREVYETPGPAGGDEGGVAMKPEPAAGRLQPECVATHSTQLRLMWNALSQWRRSKDIPDLTFEEAAVEAWTVPPVVSKLIHRPEAPRCYILEAARLFRFLYDEAKAAAILPVRRGRLVIE